MPTKVPDLCVPISKIIFGVSNGQARIYANKIQIFSSSNSTAIQSRSSPGLRHIHLHSYQERNVRSQASCAPSVLASCQSTGTLRLSSVPIHHWPLEPRSSPNKVLSLRWWFWCKYFSKADADHFLNSLHDNYKRSVDWAGTDYCGLSIIKWNYKEKFADISMPGYTSEACLERLQHPKPARPQNAPHLWTQPAIGSLWWHVNWIEDRFADVKTSLPTLTTTENRQTTQLIFERDESL